VAPKKWALKYWRVALLLVVATSMTVLVFGYHHDGTAQNRSTQLSLNSAASFPGDI